MFYNWLRPDFVWLLSSLWLSILLLHPANEIYGDFWSILLRIFRFEYIVTAFSYLITIEWILCIISTACWLKWHEIYVYCYSCNIYFVFNDIDYGYVVENLIWYGYYHVRLWLFWLRLYRISFDLIHCLILFDTKQACQSLAMFYGN